MDQRELLIWAAGFFDGEGTVAICIQNHKRYNPSYILLIAVTQKDPMPLRVLHDMFGGLLYDYKVKGITYWRWQANGYTAQTALFRLYPYLLLKKERAKIGTHFQDEMVKWNADYGRRGYPPHVNEARVEYYMLMKRLNQRGVADDNPEPKKTGPRPGFARGGFKPAKNKNKEVQVTLQ